MSVHIERVLHAADLDAVLALEQAVFNNPTSREWYLRELPQRDVCFIFAAHTEQQRAAGFCAFWKVADQMHINNLAVHPQQRRRGVARALLAHAIRAATALGAVEATLEVRRSNTAARHLYGGLGFVEVGVRPSYYTQPIEDALILTRTDGMVPPQDRAHDAPPPEGRRNDG